MTVAGRIRVGIGGWTYAPWHETFYPPGLPQRSELEFASRQVTAIEVNGTFYRLQKPAVFAKWHDETPAEFVFSIKAPRYIVNRASLTDADQVLPRFFASGLEQLRTKLGPILWQLAPTKKFNHEEIASFLQALPHEFSGLNLRHVLEVRHHSFKCSEFVELARRRGVAIVYCDDEKYPNIADITADFVYARLRRCASNEPTGYPEVELQAWAERARLWCHGGEPQDLPRVTPNSPQAPARDVFIFMINGAKERAPAAARCVLQQLG